MPNACHAVRYSDICQCTTVGEGLVTNACHAVRYGDICQCTTAGEGPVTNACRAVRDSDICQCTTAGESPVSNTCHAVRDGDISQCATIVKCKWTNRGHPNRSLVLSCHYFIFASVIVLYIVKSIIPFFYLFFNFTYTVLNRFIFHYEFWSSKLKPV